VLRVFNHYESDEQNSLSQTRMLVKVGGGNPETGRSDGIHWHMNIANKVEFVAADERRQVIPWVRMTDSSGRSVEYRSLDAESPIEQYRNAPKRQMDCIDCHSRPAHDYLAPNTAVDRSIDAGRLNASIPFIKARAVETLSKEYTNTDEAVFTIAADLNGYYRSNDPQLIASDPRTFDAAVAEVQRIYKTYFFPEMKTDWRANINNIGHLTAQG
jgi:hypothetical protein